MTIHCPRCTSDDLADVLCYLDGEPAEGFECQDCCHIFTEAEALTDQDLADEAGDRRYHEDVDRGAA